MNPSLGRRYFQRAVQQPETAIDLERAAFYIAVEEYPDLDVDAYLNALDTMALEVQERLPVESYPLRILRSLNQYLYGDLGFRGNTDNYYDPRNSFLNDVLDRRTGIPISLSLVYLAIARRIGFPMTGIGLPGHFLIRPSVDDMEVFVDPFNQGQILFPEDCQERLSQVFGQPVTMQPAFLSPVTSRQFLARMLTNLKGIYLQQGNLQKALAAVDRILLLFPGTVFELRDRGVLHYRLQHYTAARQDLETYLKLAPGAEDANIVQQILSRIRLEQT